MEDPHQILGVDINASKEELKKAFKKKCKETHPDHNPGLDGTEFQLIVHSYRLITDPSYKYRDEEEKQPLEVNVVVSLEQLAFGAHLTTYVRKVKIEATDEEATPLRKGAANASVVEIVDYIKPGTLVSPISKSYPQLAFEGGVRIDVVIHYTLRDHPRYKLEKTGLSVKEKIPAQIAIDGGVFEVESLFGIRQLAIDPGTQQDDEYIIPDHGFLGNLIVKITGFIIPEKGVASERREKLKEHEKLDRQFLEKMVKDAERLP